ncbi:uncharacterized protein LOC144657896 [Oculina patagonica]
MPPKEQKLTPPQKFAWYVSQCIVEIVTRFSHQLNVKCINAEFQWRLCVELFGRVMFKSLEFNTFSERKPQTILLLMQTTTFYSRIVEERNGKMKDGAPVTERLHLEKARCFQPWIADHT